MPKPKYKKENKVCKICKNKFRANRPWQEVCENVDCKRENQRNGHRNFLKRNPNYQKKYRVKQNQEIRQTKNEKIIRTKNRYEETKINLREVERNSFSYPRKEMAKQYKKGRKCPLCKYPLSIYNGKNICNACYMNKILDNYKPEPYLMVVGRPHNKVKGKKCTRTYKN